MSTLNASKKAMNTPRNPSLPKLRRAHLNLNAAMEEGYFDDAPAALYNALLDINGALVAITAPKQAKCWRCGAEASHVGCPCRVCNNGTTVEVRS